MTRGLNRGVLDTRKKRVSSDDRGNESSGEEVAGRAGILLVLTVTESSCVEDIGRKQNRGGELGSEAA